MESKKVNILGTEYEIITSAPDEMIPEGADGVIDTSIKRICIPDFESDGTLKDLDSYKKCVIRHEIIHAFLYESGLWTSSGCGDAWGANEEITDWIALQFPKMLEAFRSVNAL